MGLLDNFNNLFNPQDPTSASKLAMAFSLLGNQGFGNAGMAGLNAATQFKQRQQDEERRKLQDQLLQSQIQQQQRQQQMQMLPQQFMTPKQEFMDNRDVGQPGEPQAQPGFNFSGYAQALAGFDPMASLQFQQAMRKEVPQPIKLGAGDKLLDPTNYRPLAENPKASDQSNLAQLLSEMNSLPPGSPVRKFYEAMIQKQTTHQPPVQVSYGAPVAGVDEAGKSVFFQPSKDGSTPPSIVKGVKPAPQNRDTKLPAELQRMQIAGDAMEALLNDYEGMLKKHNPRDPMVQANPSVRAEMQSLKRNLELQFKELQALGALAGPDVDIMRQALSDPFSFSGAYYGKEGLLSQVGQARSLIKKRKDAVLRSQGQATQDVDNDPLGLRK